MALDSLTDSGSTDVPPLGEAPAMTPAPRAVAPVTEAVPSPVWIKRGTRDYRNANLGLFLLGFASFSLIYCVQPLLPAFAHSFDVSPAESSLALSLTTGLLAISILLASAFSQAFGRRGLMFVSLSLAAVLTIIASVTPSWHGLLATRALEGIILGGVPAVAMAWLAEEIDPLHLGQAMGLYVAGTAFGGMMGRVGMGLITEVASWRVALGVLGAICLLAAIGFFILLPRSRNFVAQPGFNVSYHLRAWGGHLRNIRLLRVYGMGFALMGIFVTLFNYTTFRLVSAPFHMGETAISLLFLSYGFGIVSSSISGGLADRFGRRMLLVSGFVLMLAGIGLTLLPSLIAIIAGIALVAIGFFVGHSVASGAVGPLAGTSKGHASSLYLLFYYVGSSVIGSTGGWFWEHGGWNAVAALIGALAIGGIVLALTVPANAGRRARQLSQ